MKEDGKTEEERRMERRREGGRRKGGGLVESARLEAGEDVEKGIGKEVGMVGKRQDENHG